METVRNQLQITAQGFVDEGDGVVSFPNGLTITDNTIQRNGTHYDIDSLNVSRYSGQLTGDHVDTLSNLIGETIGVVKTNGRVLVSKIRYAINENPYARLAYNLLVGGFSKNFSTETIGPLPDELSGKYLNHELVGLSQVVTQNNYNAHVNQFNEVVHNSLEQSRADGLDVSGIEAKILNSVEEESKMEDKEKNKDVESTEKVEETKTNVEETKVKETKVEATDKPETKEPETVTEKKVENEVDTGEAKKEEVEEVVKTTETEKQKETESEVVVADDTAKETDTEKETKEEDTMSKTENSVLTAEQVAEIVANALKPVTDELASVKESAKNAFDASAEEPKFKSGTQKEEVVVNKFATMEWKDRYQAQVDAAWNAVKLNNVDAWKTLNDINQVNLDALKKEGIARNAITLDDLGNFVIPPEMYNEIVGHRNDYTAILANTEWRETNSLEFAWLKRVGDINMTNVAIGTAYDWHEGAGAVDGDDDDRLKPISEYSAVPQVSQLEELAAVTVVATSATRFAAVDLLSDAAQGYRTDYDRKRAQLVIAKLEGAVDTTGYSTAYNPGSDTAALTTWLTAITSISDTTLNGTLIFNAKTFAELKKRALQAGISGPLSEILITGDVPMIFGYRYVIVPNDLMPSLGGSETITHYVNGLPKTINHAIFYADLTTFTGRTSGGLMYDVSNSAAYETGGQVRSAYQRNELVLRGSFFRGGAVRDDQLVAGIRQGNSANAS